MFQAAASVLRKPHAGESAVPADTILRSEEMVDCGLPLPCEQTVDIEGPALSITNKKNEFGGGAVAGFAAFGVAVVGAAISPGPGRESITTGVQGTAQDGTGVQGTSVTQWGVRGGGGTGGVEGSSGQGIGVSGSSAFGSAGVFEIQGRFSSDPPNPNPALLATTPSTGPAGVFTITGPQPGEPSNSNPAIVATTGRNGPAALFQQRRAEGANQGVVVTTASGGGEGVLISTRATGLFSIGIPAGIFSGDVNIFGNLTATGKSFVIDHPLDPANTYLVHAGVESSERTNLYTGNVSLDDNGEAVVTLPGWMAALNEDFRYQLTCIGGTAPIYVAQEVSQGSFTIAGGGPGMKVSWQLVGLRKDPWAQAHPLVVEEEKSPGDKGFYRHPEVIGQGAEKSAARPSNPEFISRAS
jgi:hypothetical protein